MQLKNDLLLRAAKGEKVERVPVWLMRQAGRILPEYRSVRASLSGFIELVKTPERAAEVTLQPVDILGVDAAIIFSDILVIPEAMGLPYQMEEKKGPFFPKTIQCEADVMQLSVASGDELDYVFKAIELTKRELNGRVPLIGFSGAPFTIFCYMVEGGGSKTFSKSKRMLFEYPEISHLLLEKITQSTLNYLKGQVKAGADLIQIFDSWAGILGPEHYRIFSLPYINTLVEGLQQEVPVTVFAKGASFAFEDMAKLNMQVVGVDWNIEPKDARQKTGSKKTLQGNLDPCVLYGPNGFIKKETEAMIDGFGTQQYIANLGHGVYPDTDFEKVKYFIETVKEYSAKKAG